MQALAHDLIDIGADLYWGHSNHAPQGIELYKGRVILYSTGDFVDDYWVDQEERNDLSFLFMLEGEGGRIERVRLYPTCIENLGVRTANEREASILEETMTRKCAAFGVQLEFEQQVGIVSIV